MRKFDFEERTPFPMPSGFYRYHEPSEGFTLFGETRLTDAVAFQGDRSFEFSLQSGSVSARVSSGVIPIMPLADYTITARVRTKDITHARARVAAWFNDVLGNPIPESRIESELIATDGAWTMVSIDLSGQFVEAGDLAIELMLVQPAEFAGLDELNAEPRLQDIRGRAWFDDVVIWQTPRVDLQTQTVGNVLREGDPQQLVIRVRDSANERLTARLRVFDLYGRLVHEHASPVSRSGKQRTMPLPSLALGWYRAVLDVNNSEMIVGRQQLDFAIVPKSTARESTALVSFGADVPHMPTRFLEDLPPLLENLGVRHASVSVWDRVMPSDLDESDTAKLRQTIGEILGRWIEVTMTLDSIPNALAADVGLHPSRVVELLSDDTTFWLPSFQRMLIDFGEQISRWRIGSGLDLGPMTGEAQRRDLVKQHVYPVFASFVPLPTLVAPWPAETNTGAPQRGIGYHIALPHHIQPQQVIEYIARIMQDESDIRISLGVLPDDTYSEEQQVIDLAMRTLHAWRAGADNLAIDAPWRILGERRAQIMPSATYPAWRGLADHLSQRQFVHELPITDGAHCWIADGPGGSALIAWNEMANTEDAVIRDRLAEGPVVVIDIFGNRQIVEPIDGVHTIELTHMPLFIENVNAPLAQFRASFAITPSFIPSEHRVHELDLVMRNPWPLPISGELTLYSPERWVVTPAVHEFAIPAGEDVRIPIDLHFDRSMTSGRMILNADISVQADQAYSVRTRAQLEIGLAGIKFVASPGIMRNAATGQIDLVVNQYITNESARAINLEAFVLAEGFPTHRFTIGFLEPGQSVYPSFRLPNGAAKLAGQEIRVGVMERDGIASLNQMLKVPPMPVVTAAQTP